jgi:hypothetical protein
VSNLFFKIGKRADVQHPPHIGKNSRYSLAIPESNILLLREKIYDLQFRNSKVFQINGSDHVTENIVANFFDMTVEELRLQISNNAFLSDYIISTNIDVVNNDYTFRKEVLELSRYKSLNQCAKQLDISYATLLEYRRNGKLPQPSFLQNTNLYVFEDIKNTYLEIKKENFEQRPRGMNIRLVNKYEMLHPDLKKIVDDYFYHREKGYRIIFEGKEYNNRILSRRFLLWTLMRLELNVDAKNVEEITTFARTKHNFKRAMIYIPEAMFDEDSSKNKIFLSRTQALEAIGVVRSYFRV